jgi:hypothetical protein
VGERKIRIGRHGALQQLFGAGICRQQKIDRRHIVAERLCRSRGDREIEAVSRPHQHLRAVTGLALLLASAPETPVASEKLTRP